TLQGSWSVGFDTTWGGPESVVFSDLIDWSEHPDKRIKYFSGTAVYEKSFVLKELPRTDSGKIFLMLGKVNSLARVVLNSQNLGVSWCVPWRLEIPAGLLKAENNRLRIEVANSWVNRLVGDEQEPEDSELIDYNREDTPEKFDMKALKD